MTAKVLIVDDNEINLLVAERYAIAAGFETLCAINGKEAIDLFEKERPQLVLMDLSMPEMDGFEAASEIMDLQKGDEQKSPIIAMTAHSSQTHKDKCLKAGFTGFIEKPMRLNETVETLTRFVAPAK